MSISMLVVSISMLALFVCSSIVHAQVVPKPVYNKVENAEPDYFNVRTERLLTPKVKSEYSKSKGSQPKVKVSFRWDAKTQSWAPFYMQSVPETESTTAVKLN